MPVSLDMDELHLKYKGIFNLGGVLSIVTDWLETRGYEVIIKKVKHKTKTFGFEDEYEIRGWRDETDYHRIYIDFYMHMWDANEVDVLIEGQKKRLMKARLYMSIQGKIETDPSGRFDTSMFSKALRKFMYDKVIHHKYESVWGDKLQYKMHEIYGHIKEYLDMQSKGMYFKNMW
ncbi:hypothetical protein JXB31_04135 [Candidatus Woesearchaeota archaeon]|nr:hypothetical protein [Candidatus Woesearchaeota archaeon]